MFKELSSTQANMLKPSKLGFSKQNHSSSNIINF